MDGDHRSAEAIFLEGGVLMGAVAVTVFEEFQEFAAEHAVAFAVDEDDATRLFLEMSVEGLADYSELVVENFRSRHAIGAVKELVDVEVYLDDAVPVGPFEAWQSALFACRRR